MKHSTDDYLAFPLDIKFSMFAFLRLVIDYRRQILSRAIKFFQSTTGTYRLGIDFRNILS